MAEAEYSVAQQGKIARHFIYVSPHGEVGDLMKDLKQVVSQQVLTENWIHNSMTEYCKRRFEIVEGVDTKVICCPQAEVEPNKYLNPDKRILCEVNPITQKIVNTSDAGGFVQGGQNEEYRRAITQQLKNYLDAYYEDGTSPNSVAKGTGSAFVSAEGQIAIVISFKNLNPNNYWTGGWQSEWTVSIAKKGTTKIDGRIRLNIHYYEDGNVQLNSTFNESGETRIGDPQSSAKAIVETIAKLESDFQKRLDEFYVKMHDSTFKNMRRFLPKIGKKMDWRASVHALVADAASGGT